MSLAVIGLAVAFLTAVIARLLQSSGVKRQLPDWPAMFEIAMAAARSLFKGKRISTVTELPPLEVTLTTPKSADLTRLAALLKLGDYRESVTSTSELPTMFMIAHSFRLNLALMFLPDFPLGVVGSVLARNKTFLARPITAEEQLEYKCSLDTKTTTTAKGDLEIDLVNTAVSSETGEVVWRNRLTVIVLNPKRLRGPAAGAANQEAAEQLPWTSLEQWRVGGDVGRKYGSINGDLNPIHLHPLTAQLFGFKRPIAHALFLTTRAEACLRRCGASPSYPMLLEAEFKRPTLLPAKLQCCWQQPGGTASGADLKAASASPQGLTFAVLTGDGEKQVLVGRWVGGSGVDSSTLL